MRNLGDGRRQEARELGVYRVLSKQPNFWQSSYEWMEQMAHHTALWGSGYSRIVPGERGFADQLIPLHPSRVKERMLADQTGRPVSLVYDYWGPEGSRTYQQSEILHFRWLSDNGYSGLVPAELCGTAVSLARKLDIAAGAYWDNSARPDVVLETQEQIPDPAVASLRQQWREMYGGVRNKGQTAILPRKVTARVLEGSSREAAQFMELRQSIVGEIARAFGIPSTLIGDASMAKFSNVEQEFLSAQVFTLLPWQRRMEGAIDRSIRSTYGDEVYCKLDNRGLLRGDTAARASLYQALWGMGSIRPNEIRALEDLPLLEEPAAEKTYVQLGFSTLEAAAAQSQAAAAADPGSESQGGGVPEAGGFSEGQRVYWADGEGVIEHLMIDGVLGVEGSPYAIAATEAEPAASVRVYEDGEPTEFTVGKRVAELSATPLDAADGQAPADGVRFDPNQPRDQGGRWADLAAAVAAGDEQQAKADLAASGFSDQQVAALVDVLSKIAAGGLDHAEAVATITSAFPAISDATAKQMADGAQPQAPAGGPDNGT
jgi:HK97 family phage portal protein